MVTQLWLSKERWLLKEKTDCILILNPVFVQLNVAQINFHSKMIYFSCLKNCIIFAHFSGSDF